MHPRHEWLLHLTRRHFLKESRVGLGTIAFSSVLAKDAPAGTPARGIANPLGPRPPQFAAKAKRVIYLHLTGSPPHLDLFDYKPELVKRDGQLCPDQFIKGKRFAFTTGTPRLLGTRAGSPSMARTARGCPMPSLICTRSPMNCA